MGNHGVLVAVAVCWSDTLIIQYTGKSSTTTMSTPNAVCAQRRRCRLAVGDIRASLVHRAPVGPQVEQREGQGDGDEDVAERGSLTEVELHKGQMVGLRRDGLCRI